MLREIVCLNLGERQVVGALEVGDRRTRDGECCYQHRDNEHRAQQCGFGKHHKSLGNAHSTLQYTMHK
jgi:hypothetical protein